MTDAFSQSEGSADARRYFLSDNLSFKKYFAEGRERLKAAEAINNNVSDIVSNAIQSMIQEDPSLISPGGNLYPNSKKEACKQQADIILRGCCAVLIGWDASMMVEGVLKHLKETYITLGVPISAVARAVYFMKNATISLVRTTSQGEGSTLVDDLVGDYFDQVVVALEDGYIQQEEVEADDVGELMTDLNLSNGTTRRMHELLERLSELLDGSNKYVRIWLSSPHPDLGGDPPLFYLEQGKPEVIEGLVEAIESGQIG